MSKIIPILLVTGFLGVLSGCATKPQPVQANQQEQNAKADAERKAAAAALAQAEADKRAALAAAEDCRQELNKLKEENAVLKGGARKKLKK